MDGIIHVAVRAVMYRLYCTIKNTGLEIINYHTLFTFALKVLFESFPYRQYTSPLSPTDI